MSAFAPIATAVNALPSPTKDVEKSLTRYATLAGASITCSRMAKKLKLQQERAVIPGRKPWTCGKDRDFGRERVARPAASTSAAEPDMTAKRAMNGGASNCLGDET